MSRVPRTRGCWGLANELTVVFEDILIDGSRKGCLEVRGKQRGAERGMVQKTGKGAVWETRKGHGRSRRAKCANEVDAMAGRKPGGR